MTPYYSQDGIVIYHGDCREVLPSLGRFDLLLTDPPYGIAWTRGTNHARSSAAHNGIANDHDTAARDAALLMLSDIPGIVFGSFYAPYPANLKQVLVWHKPADAGVVGSTTGYRRYVEPVFLVGPWPQKNVKWPAVMRSARNSIAHIAAETGHPHTKPVDILCRLLDRAPDGSVVDPFMGSGSSLLAARSEGRPCTGIEIEERYCEIAAQRLAQGVLDFGDNREAA